MKSDVLERLKALIGRPGLGEWDENFIHSLKDQFEKRGRLSERQLEILAKVESRYTADAVMSRIKWEEKYDEEKQNIAKICATYYDVTGYFRDLVNSVLHVEGFIPTEKQWDAMCCNKYATKVLEAAFDTPKFPAGSMIMIRKTCPSNDGRKLYRRKRDMGTDLAVVVSDSEPIVSASRGNRRYKILFVGDSAPLFAEERDIKKLSKKYQKK